MGSLEYLLPDTDDRAGIVSTLMGITMRGWAVSVDPVQPRPMEAQFLTIEAPVPPAAIHCCLMLLGYVDGLALPEPLTDF